MTDRASPPAPPDVPAETAPAENATAENAPAENANAANDRVPHHLGQNIRNLRAARGSTQVQMARAAGIPRATWANLETGSANPTLAVLLRVAGALRVTLEELLAAPRSHARLHRAGTLPTRRPGGALVQKLLPDPIPGVEIERIELAPGQRMIGVPHTPGTREYLTCEAGQLDLTVNGEHWRLTPGDVLTFRGDQRHSYANAGEATAVGYSTILLAPAFA